MYTWNNAYNYIMCIKRKYIEKFGNLDTYSVEEMCKKLNTAEYKNFLACVSIAQYNEYNLFKYSLIKGGDIDIYTNTESIYREMRGLVVNIKTDEIVLCPFRKFFNVEELEETSLSVVYDKLKKATTVEVANKMDGSMLSVGYYNNEFVLAGTGSLELASGNERLIECRQWLTKNYQNLVKSYPDMTFMFEYISHNDKHVVQYKEEEQGLYLVGARNKFDGSTLTYKELFELSQIFNVKTTYTENLNFKTIWESVDDFSAQEKEGWVIRIDNDMYKVKCNDYVALHTLLYSLNGNVVIKAIVDGTYDDILAKFPQDLKPRVYEYSDVVFEYLKLANAIIDKYYDKYKHLTDRKEFSQAISQNVPKMFIPYLYCKIYGYEYNVLKTHAGRYDRFFEVEKKLAFCKSLDI